MKVKKQFLDSLMKENKKDLIQSFLAKEDIVSWVEKIRSKASVESGVPKIAFEKFPWQKKILSAMASRDIHKIIIMAGSQLGKSELFLNLIFWWATHRGGNILLLFSNENEARDFLASRFQALIESNPVLQNIFPIDTISLKEKKINRLLSRVYQGNFSGKLFVRSGSVPSSYRSVVASLVILDEVDVYKSKEGLDPIFQAESRMGSISRKDRKLIAISTPLAKSKSFIRKHFDNSSQYFYELYCKLCKKYFRFCEDSVIQDQDFFFINCSHCKRNLFEKFEAIKKGRWFKSTNGLGLGFHFSRILSPFLSLEEFHELRKYRPPKDFQSDIMGLPFDDAFQNPIFSQILTRKINFSRIQSELDKEILLITAAADLQSDRVEMEIVGWGALVDGVRKSYSLEYKIFHGEVQGNLLWNRIFDFIIHFQFRSKKIKCFVIDKAFLPELIELKLNDFRIQIQKTDANILASSIRGLKNSYHEDSSFFQNYYENGKRTDAINILRIIANGSVLKDYFFLNLTNRIDSFYFPEDRNIDFFKKLLSERKNFRGIYEKTYFLNESLDCRVYGMAAAELYFKYQLHNLKEKKK